MLCRLLARWEGSLYYTARDGICLVLGRWGVSLTHPCFSLVVRRVGSLSYTPRTGICLFSRLLMSLYCTLRQKQSLSYTLGAVIFLVLKCVGSFSYRPRVSLFVGREISLARPVLVSVLG